MRKKNKSIVRLCILGVCIFLSAGILYSAGKRYAAVITGTCVGCGDCVRICPKEATVMTKGKVVIDLELCNGCGLCYSICSYNAIRITERTR